ncbi:MAG: phosphoribosyltransferase, partial [Chlamydiae bacterium]|nr:phosphoribosyltransferase [Chlamydiota bacterium]
LDLLFPPLCIHCAQPTKQLVCPLCAHFFEFLPPGRRYLACFSDIESVSTFVHLLRSSPRCQKAAISFLILQHERAKWPLPDLITSVPKRHFWSSNISAILARGVARKLRIPFRQLAYRCFGDLPKVEKPQFFLRKRVEAERILIIDDYMDRGATMRSLARTLQQGSGAQLCGLAISQI